MSASQQVGDVLRGRLQIDGRMWNVRANVRHVTGLAPSHGENLVGLEFMDDLNINAALPLDNPQPASLRHRDRVAR